MATEIHTTNTVLHIKASAASMAGAWFIQWLVRPVCGLYRPVPVVQTNNCLALYKRPFTLLHCLWTHFWQVAQCNKLSYYQILSYKRHKAIYLSPLPVPGTFPLLFYL